MSEWLCVVAMIFMYLNGYLTAWAISHQDEPFWDGYLNGYTLGLYRRFKKP